MKRQCQRREERERRKGSGELGGTAVSFNNRRMCIPGDNRVYVLGLQCTGDEEETDAL